MEFNHVVRGWLEGSIPIREHSKLAAFEGIKSAYDHAISITRSAGLSPKDGHREVLSKLTKLLFGYDLAEELKERLNPGLVNDTGFRTTLSQGVAKNVGENFVNLDTSGNVAI